MRHVHGLILTTFSLALLSNACGRPAAEHPDVIDLVALLPQATLEQVKPNGSVSMADISVGGITRSALFMHPKSRATFPPVRLTLQSRLELSLGIREEAWDKPGDGVQFSVYAQRGSEPEVRIFSSYVDPKHEQRDRKWIDAVVLLGVYAGQDVTLILETDPGPEANDWWDWAGWSRAVVMLGEQ